MTTTPRKSAPWHGAALQKFYSLSAQAAGLRSAIGAAREQRDQIRRKIAQLEAERDDLVDTIGSAPVLSGREADRHRSHDRVAEIDVDLVRQQAVLSEVLRLNDDIAARQRRLDPLLNACAGLLVKLRLLRREEAL